MTNKKLVNVMDRYSHEINEIKNRLIQLENGKVYDLTNCKGDGYLSTHIQKLESQLNELLLKIEFDKPGIQEKIGSYFIK